jgi:hypothetical protein
MQVLTSVILRFLSSNLRFFEKFLKIFHKSKRYMPGSQHMHITMPNRLIFTSLHINEWLYLFSHLYTNRIKYTLIFIYDNRIQHMQETMQNRLICPPKLFNEAQRSKDLTTFDRYVYVLMYIYAKLRK